MKRQRTPATEQEVSEWFVNLQKENALSGYGDLDWENLIKNVRSRGITGDVLLSLTRNDLNSLGVTRIGPRITILGKIDEIKRSICPAKGGVESLSLSSDNKLISLSPLHSKYAGTSSSKCVSNFKLFFVITIVKNRICNSLNLD